MILPATMGSPASQIGRRGHCHDGTRNPRGCRLRSGRSLMGFARGLSPGSGSGGFTLIEVLVSLVLLIVVLGALYSSFFTVRSSLERFDGVSLKYQEARTILDLLRREVEGALYKGSPTDDPDSNQTDFIIEDRDIFGRPSSRLHLTSCSFRGKGLHQIAYQVTEKGNTLALTKSESPPFHISPDRSPRDIRMEDRYVMEILDGIEGFTVETLSRGKWIRTWDTRETGSLPDLVKVSIDFDDGGQTVTLSEYAKPRIGRQL